MHGMGANEVRYNVLTAMWQDWIVDENNGREQRRKRDTNTSTGCSQESKYSEIRYQFVEKSWSII